MAIITQAELLPHAADTAHPDRLECEYMGCDQLATVHFRGFSELLEVRCNVNDFCPTHAAEWADAWSVDLPDGWEGAA